MSAFTKTVLALGLLAGLSGTALAQSGGGEPWVLRANMGYVVDAKGNTMIIDLGKMDPKMKKKAQVVKKNTVFYMQDGKLMMSDWATGQ